MPAATAEKAETPKKTSPLETHPTAPYKPENSVRIVTATALFDGHDASINIMRRHPPGDGCGGHPPGPQPQRRGGGRRGDARKTPRASP